MTLPRYVTLAKATEGVTKYRYNPPQDAVDAGVVQRTVLGEDKDIETRYTVTSVGGKRAVQALALAIASQVEKDQTKPVPVVRLKKEHYMHKSYGRIYTPVFDIVEWIGMDGGSTEVDAPPVADAPAEAPADPRRRRRA